MDVRSPGTDVIIFEIVSPKKLTNKNGVCYSKYCCFNISIDYNIDFEEKRQCFRRKLLKFAEKSDHNIELRFTNYFLENRLLGFWSETTNTILRYPNQMKIVKFNNFMLPKNNTTLCPRTFNLTYVIGDHSALHRFNMY
jgi:hypothetical protein